MLSPVALFVVLTEVISKSSSFNPDLVFGIQLQKTLISGILVMVQVMDIFNFHIRTLAQEIVRARTHTLTRRRAHQPTHARTYSSTQPSVHANTHTRARALTHTP